MGKVILEMSVSLDGFGAGPDVSAGNPMGKGGVRLAQSFIRAGLLDEINIYVVPVLLHQGARLFDQTGEDRIELERINCIPSSDVTHLFFRILRNIDTNLPLQ